MSNDLTIFTYKPHSIEAIRLSRDTHGRILSLLRERDIEFRSELGYILFRKFGRWEPLEDGEWIFWKIDDEFDTYPGVIRDDTLRYLYDPKPLSEDASAVVS